DFDEAFTQVDAIVAPTSPTVAFPIGARTDDPYQMYLSDVFTIPANMAGIPAIAVPCGMSDGLPVSLQVIGKPFDEATIFHIGDAYERAEPWVGMRPPQ
nr:amidase family protein [Chloroflexota bacterium]